MLEDYRRYAEEYGLNIRGADATATNKAFDALTDIGRRIIRAGDGRLLLSLFDDPDPWVQLCAASHALEVDESSAVAKLRELAEARIRLASMTAELTLEAWNKGELRLLEED